MAMKDLKKAASKFTDTTKELANTVNAGLKGEFPGNGSANNGGNSGDSLHNNTPFTPYKPDDKEQAKLTRRAQVLGLGDPDAALENAFYGLNIKAHTAMVPQNQEKTGLIFFTKPNCYLSDANCVTDRHFVPMLTQNSDSFQAAYRAYLDPLGQRERDTQINIGPYVNSVLVDPNNPFIALLTNTCKTLTGWPDPIMDTFVSERGRRQEVYGLADGVYKVYSDFDLTGTFKNIPFDPVRQLFDYWCMYQSNVSMGRMYPRLSSIINIRVNYQTRIWRIVLDKSRQIVTRIGCTGASHPLVTDIGRIFDYDAEKTQVETNDVTMQFKSYGAIYNDPLLVVLFNQLVSYFNQGLSVKKFRESSYQKLKPGEWGMFNHSAYPLINEETRELEWWCLKENYDLIQNYYGPAGLMSSEDPVEKAVNIREIIKNVISR